MFIQPIALRKLHMHDAFIGVTVIIQYRYL